MRRYSCLTLGSFLVLTACGRSPAEPSIGARLEALSGSYTYAATYQGADFLTGYISLLRSGDSVSGVWDIRLTRPTDPPQPGCVVGVGQLVGAVVGDTLLHLDMNPGWADCNVWLALKPTADGGFHGQWDFSGFAGPMAQGTASLRRWTPGPD